MTKKKFIPSVELSKLQARFSSLAAAESYACRIPTEESGIGIYNEKRFHRLLKRTLCQNEDCFEVKVGRYVADILEGNLITEIQSGAMGPLEKKLRFYLENTDCNIRVVHPLVAERRIIRAKREDGEIVGIRTSPKRERCIDGLAKLYPIRELLSSLRISVCFAVCSAEEYRYSERMRYRKEGRYDSDLFPIELLDFGVFSDREDYRALLPPSLKGVEFTAKEFGRGASLCGRNIYSALHTLTAVGVLSSSKQGRAYVWREAEV